MPNLRLTFRAGNLSLPDLGLLLDPREPQRREQRVFISHAHADHIGAHREVILSAPTAVLMKERLDLAPTLEHVLNFGEARRFEHPTHPYEVTLLPAGHIFGSAMGLIRCGGESVLYTGDFKLRRGLSAEACEPRRADILIMETTFGRPQYVFPPAAEVMKGVVRFCREALDNDETAVLLGYSLGKSQELLCSLGEAGLPLMLHGAVWRLTQIYERFGRCFPPYTKYSPSNARGNVLLCPPNVVNSAMMRKLGKTRSAILTGWAMDPNCRFRYQCDAAFPLSDHADFPELVELVRKVEPRKVYTLHGFAADFAQHLRSLGYDAQALSEDEQLSLALATLPARSRPLPRANLHPPDEPLSLSTHVREAVSGLAGNDTGLSPGREAKVEAFVSFALVCQQVASERRKLEKVRLVAEFLRGLSLDAVAATATWFSGQPFPSAQNKVLKLGWALLRDSLCAVAQIDEAALYQVYLKHSDLGEAAAEIFQMREPAPSLTIGRIQRLFDELHVARGQSGKFPLLTAVLARCTAVEAKFLVKIITGDLRVGLKEGLVEEAVAEAFGQLIAEVRYTNLLLGDVSETARLAAEGRLGEATLRPLRPIKFMLASPEPTAQEVWQRIHGDEKALVADGESEGRTAGPEARTVWLEDKYDGVRCQLHKVGNQVALFSRDLKNITQTFPEVSDAARALGADFIVDGEIIAKRRNEILPFAQLQKRLGRRELDLFMHEEVPIRYVVFDLLWLEGRDWLGAPLRERREQLEKLLKTSDAFDLARIARVSSAAEIDRAFDAAQARGNEGLMIKNPASSYMPGRRGLAWLKLKKAFATLDCVVVGAEYGHGKRNQVLSDYTFAVRDEEAGDLITIGKAYSGLTDIEIEELTQHFFSKVIRRHGRYFEVEPDTVLEIAFDRIQASDRHSSGLALRFPRIARVRGDKTPAEIDTLATARKLARAQADRTPGSTG